MMRIPVKNTRYCISLHGGGEDQRGWAAQGKTDLIIDNLIAEKKAVPMIVIWLTEILPLNGFGEEGTDCF